MGRLKCSAGQFAVRGGILDVYSPMSAPVRVEFFDTEIDAMGEFDVATQRRTKNLEELTVLPAAEVLPFAAEGGRDAMLARMEHAAAQLAKKETTEKTAAAIRADMDRLREGLPLGGKDRYLAAAYPTAVCAADYLPEGSIVLVCEGSRVMERAKGCAFEWGEDLNNTTFPHQISRRHRCIPRSEAPDSVHAAAPKNHRHRAYSGAGLRPDSALPLFLTRHR